MNSQFFRLMLSSLLFGLLFCLSSCNIGSQTPENTKQQVRDYPIKPVPFTQVRITDAFWQPRLETNRRVTIPYTFQKSEETGRISNFAKAGGLEEGEFEGIFFNDSDVFKIIEGASYSLQVHRDPQLKQYLDDLIAKIVAAQEEDGYLYTNRTINPEKAADKGGAQRWTNLRVHHELYNVGHMYEAAVAHYQATGERSLLDVALKNADLIDRTFGPGKNRGVPGHQEIEIGLVKLFRVTGEQRYLDLAKFFVDQRGDSTGHKLYGEYAQDHLPLSEQREATGHAVRAGYYYAGATDVAALTGEKAYDTALEAIWEDIVHQKIYLTGGIGAEPRHEGFGPDYELPNATAYTETCAAIALMLWNHRLFLRSGDVKYMDVFERSLYNGFLAGVSFAGNTFFYPNPLETDGVHPFNQGVCGRSPWFDCSCCPVNVVRVMPSLPGYIYATQDQAVYVNLFIGSEAQFDVAGQPLSIKQITQYPWVGEVSFVIENENPVFAEFHIRLPGWARNEVMPGDLYRFTDDESPSARVLVNGKDVKAELKSGYLVLEKRNWQSEDEIQLVVDMLVRKVQSHEQVAANEGKIAIERGPLVYTTEAADNPGGVSNLAIDPGATLNYEFKPNLLKGVGVIEGQSTQNGKQAPFRAIPYYAWAHREMGEMAVWLAAQ